MYMSDLFNVLYNYKIHFYQIKKYKIHVTKTNCNKHTLTSKKYIYLGVGNLSYNAILRYTSIHSFV